MRAWIFGLAAWTVIAGSAPAQTTHPGQCVDSPGRVLTACVSADGSGAFYAVYRGDRVVIAHSALGIAFEGGRNGPATEIANVQRSSFDQSWTQPWGEQRVIRDNHSEMRVSLSGPNAEPYDLIFRVFDDGFGFRYDYKSIPAGQDVAITDERTEFGLVGDWDAWWYYARQRERDEYLYHRAPLWEVTVAETPLTLQSKDGLYLSIHEAALVDYSSMNLRRVSERVLKADLMPWSDGILVRRTGPFQTPWRMVLVSTTPMGLADSRIELNLNEPSQIADTSWIQIGKYVGVWWEMHLGHSTWGSGPHHGATTANVERYMDFAQEHHFHGVLAEGWNRGWDGDWIANGKDFSFTQSYPDFDMDAIAAYGRARDVRLIGHNETAGAVENYERQLEAAMTLYEQHGVRTVKTGYVRPNGSIERTLPDGTIGHEWFAGQYRVRHELHVVQVAAAHHVAIDAHEAVKDTGLRRTWPNMLSREAARGQEYNAWAHPTSPPDHLTILPFTRLLSGPMDFTPGIFDLTYGRTSVDSRVQSTLATQLAEYVVIYSPIEMAADLPENYRARPDVFKFIDDVPTDWEISRTLQAEIGAYVVTAREQRGGRDWYLGAITNQDARTLHVPLDFLAPGKSYEAQIYRDAPNADYRTNPEAIEIARQTVTARDTLTLALAPGGGQAIRFKALD
ncbi:MAG: glycoside hydrolase family 97 protein [Pseudomonadota bacterium]